MTIRWQSEAITYLDEEEDEEAELARDRASILWGKGGRRRGEHLQAPRERASATIRLTCSLTHSLATKIVRHTETGVLPPPA